MAVGTAKQTNGFADVFGGKQFNAIDYSGPKSYVNGTGDAMDPKGFGFNNAIESFIGASMSQSGTYLVRYKPTNNGVTAWHLFWYVISTGAEVANTTDLSAETVKLAAIGF